MVSYLNALLAAMNYGMIFTSTNKYVNALNLGVAVLLSFTVIDSIVNEEKN